MRIDDVLDDIEARLDEETEAQLWEQWLDFVHDRCPTPVFAPRRPQSQPPRFCWQTPSINQTLDDPQNMVLHQLSGLSDTLANARGSLLTVRANYGTCILPIILGADSFQMPESTNTLPSSHPIGRDGISKMLDAGIPSFDTPYAKRVLDTSVLLQETLNSRPKLGRFAVVYHPDTQGPMDILEMLWGSEIFLFLVDEPELIHQALELITQTYLQFMAAWEKIVPPREDGIAAHWGFLHRGRVVLRDDSAMNLSPHMIEEFILPYDQKILTATGGGAIHACGRVDHYVDIMTRLHGVTAFNFTQPHLNEMEKVWSATVDRGLMLLGMPDDAARSALNAGRTLHGRVHV